VAVQAGVLEREQRLFLDGKELAFDDSLSSVSATVPLMLVRTVSDPRTTNLSHFYAPATFAEVPASGFTVVRKISEGLNGDIFRYRARREVFQECPDGPATVDVAVKKLRSLCLKRSSNLKTSERAVHLEPWKNAPPEEDALTEIGVMSYLSKQPDLPKYLIRMLGCFSDPRHTWLVSEFADGGEFFDLVSSGRVGDKALRYSWELLQAVDYLHKHYIAHRDISLENMLVKDNSVKLMDFGHAVRSHSESGTALRYFRAAGKNFYRAPECYVPTTPEVGVVTPSESAPGDVVMIKTEGYLCEVRLPPNSMPGKRCKAEVWGYEAQPMDIFSAGMAVCILCCGFPIWQKALLSDPGFSYVHTLGHEGIPTLLKQWGKPLPPAGAMQLLNGMLRSDTPAKRLSASECLASPWFSSLNEPGDHTVNLHAPAG